MSIAYLTSLILKVVFHPIVLDFPLETSLTGSFSSMITIIKAQKGIFEPQESPKHYWLWKISECSIELRYQFLCSRYKKNDSSTIAITQLLTMHEFPLKLTQSEGEELYQIHESTQRNQVWVQPNAFNTYHECPLYDINYLILQTKFQQYLFTKSN